MSDPAQTVADLELNELQQEVALGFDMERFKESVAGRYFQLRAQNDILDALQRLKVVDPHDFKGIVKEQLIIQSREQVLVWMSDAINLGAAAEQSLEARQQESADPV